MARREKKPILSCLVTIHFWVSALGSQEWLMKREMLPLEVASMWVRLGRDMK